MARKRFPTMRAFFVLAVALGFAFEASAIPMASKGSMEYKTQKSGELSDVDNGPAGPLALPVPGSLWLVALGVAGIAAVRRKPRK